MPYAEPVPIDEPATEGITPDIIPGQYDAYTVAEHRATQAWDMGYDGTGVNIAIIDSGVDFAHPDLMGRWATEDNMASPYYGWPIVLDVNSIDIYENTGSTEGTWYADTSFMTFSIGDFVYFNGYRYNVSDIPSFADIYFIGYHPDPNLASYYGEPVAVLLPINVSSMRLDTVYVDLLNDKTFNNDKPCTKASPVSYFDSYNETADVTNTTMWNAGDGMPDVSGGIVYWIADGANFIPYADYLYGSPTIPGAGQLVCFSGEFLLGESHGTGCAASAVGTGASMDGMLAGMAPGARIITIPTYNSASIMDIWVAAVLGYDGTPGTGDEAQIASNSYGFDSMVTESGFDIYAMMNYMIASVLPDTIWCWSTGNGGPGYGTANSITHPLAVQVGAASSMGYRYPLGSAATENEMYGDVIPFSDHGPTKTGKLVTDVIAAGAWGLTPAPLYTMLGYPDGNATWMTFGGTSMACPVTAGALAMVYQAYDDAHGFFPTSQTAKSILMSSADDVNHDVLRQGAGFINVERAVKLAADIEGIMVSTLNFDNLYYDSMENGADGWTTNAYLPGSDMWHITSTFSYNGAYCWYMGQEPGYNYSNGAQVSNSLVSPILDTTQLMEPHLSFYQYYETEVWAGGDWCFVQVSDDGGSGWNTIGSYRGDSVTWINTDLDVSAYSSHLFQIRFYFDTGDPFSNNYFGWLIDDIQLYDNNPVLLPTEISDNVWYPGSYMGINWTMFPNIAIAGQTYQKTLRIENHDLANPVMVNITDAIFKKTSSDSITYTTTDPGAFFIDITGLYPVGVDLIRVTAYCSYDDYFDPGRTYSPMFNYGLELQNWIDLDLSGDPASDGSEFNRITVDGGVSNILQVTMGDPISRINDGLFLRMRPYYGGEAGIVWNFVIDCYEKTDWSWIDNVPSLLIGAGETGRQLFTMNVSSNATVGTYEGAIYLTAAGNTTVVPVLIHIAATGPEFEFGGNLLDETIYDSNMSGTADRGWRYEVGDWRVYYMDVDPGYLIGANDMLYVTVNWTDVPTDIDVHMLVPNAGLFDQPFMLAQSGASEEYYLGAGTFGFKTSTGGPKEVVSVPFDHMLNAIALRNPIGAGLLPYELMTGFTRVFDDSSGLGAWPSSIDITLNIPAVVPKGNFPIEVDIGSMSGMSGVEFGSMTFGPVGGYKWPGLIATQDLYTDTMFDLKDSYGYVKITTSSPVPGLDIDLYVYWLDPMTMSWVFVGASGGASAMETVFLSNPTPGTYMASVYGYTVPGVTQPFNLNVEFPMGGGASFSVSGTPATVNPWDTVMLDMEYNLPYVAGLYQGYLGFGFFGSTNTFKIPVSIELIDMGAPVLEALTPMDGETIGDNLPYMQVYFNDTAAYSGLGAALVLLDGWFVSWDIDSSNVISAWAPWILADGAHVLEIEAIDDAGNLAVPLTVTFYVDTVSVLNAWVEDSMATVIPIGGLTNETTVNVVGVAEPTSTVTVNGVPTAVNPVTGDFSQAVSLVEGPNAITVIATDAVLNTKTVHLVVELDTAVMLYVDPVASPTRLASIVISGEVEIGGQVWVDGSAVTVTNGSFSTSVNIAEGVNSLAVTAQDVAGNTKTVTVSVVRDSVAPTVTITSPSSGTSFGTSTIIVRATSEPFATVTINGVVADEEGGKGSSGIFVAQISLSNGTNTILAIATDALGNIATTSVSVTYVPTVYVRPGELNDTKDQLTDDLNQTENKLSDDISALGTNLMIAFIVLLVVTIVAMAAVYMLLSNKVKAMGMGGMPPQIPPQAQVPSPQAMVPPVSRKLRGKEPVEEMPKQSEVPPPPEERF